MSFARGLSVESAYVVRAPVRTTVSLQQQWKPVRHPELRIYAQSDFSGRGSPGDFQGLASVRSNSSVKAFVDATLRLPQDASKLQLSNAEVKAFARRGWRRWRHAGERGRLLEQGARRSGPKFCFRRSERSGAV